MRPKLLLYLGIFVLVLLSYGIFQYTYLNIIPGSGSLMITSTPSSEIFFNDKNVGKSTYQNKHLGAGEYKIRLESQSTSSANPTLNPTKKFWETKVKINPNNQVLINRELGPSNELGSGEILILERGAGLVISTQPQGADIDLDGQKIGQAPLENNTPPGVHKLTISKEGFVTRVLEVNITEGFKLISNIDLTSQVKVDSKNLNQYKNLKIVHIFPTTSLNDVSALADLINPDQVKFDILIDKSGTIFTKKEVTEKVLKENKVPILGYLAEIEAKDLSESAKKAVDNLRKEVFGDKADAIYVKINATPTGFLNVRESASISSKILSRVSPDEKYELLEEKPDWFKINLSSGSTGWVSSQYVTKLPPGQ